ncbi:MAG: c-type cytochrome [Polyangiaceae bacterium]|nr:c-type cytochrome [Polyangiaceae bacterium]NUQ79138.1 c-type cytochrome [Polyangiaceae bacterium]
MKHGEFRIWAQSGAIVAAIGAALGGCGGEPAAPADQPEITTSASRPPPPISGGTLLVLADGRTAVAADPDRDRIVLADLASKTILAEMPLEALDEPGRVVEGPPGRVHVALRRGGAVASFNVKEKQITRTPVCPAPRGMAYDAGNVIHVACAGGELVTLAADTGAVTRSLKLEPDLRDVVVTPNGLFVSLFRTAKVLELDTTGTVIMKRTLEDGFFFGSAPAVAWRMIPFGSDEAMLVHQRHSQQTVSTQTPEGYGNDFGCGGGIVRSAVTFLSTQYPDSAIPNASIEDTALPVDVAVSPDKSRFAIVGAGSNTVHETATDLYRGSSGGDFCSTHIATPIAEGQPIAVAFAGSMRVVQTREPSRLVLGDGAVLELEGESVLDTGHELFHRTTTPAIGMACASCHPEGRDDAFVWSFDTVGKRRTQSLAGGVLATAPLHWDGTLPGFDSLMGEVFTGRMGGPSQSPRRVQAIALWVDSIPFLPSSPAPDQSAAERGKALFESPAVGCATCHSGPRLTNNTSVDVGTWGVFQVPSLRGVAARAPFMHDGCAPTLRDRFSTYCGGDDRHGVTSNLSPTDIDDLVSYLETL